jgi:hypothetical protein
LLCEGAEQIGARNLVPTAVMNRAARQEKKGQSLFIVTLTPVAIRAHVFVHSFGSASVVGYCDLQLIATPSALQLALGPTAVP